MALFSFHPSDLLKLWRKLSQNRLSPALGRWLFNRLINWIIPYTGTIKSRVRQLEPGFCQVELKERRAVRNHLNSIHAIALTNLGEFSSGLALISQFSNDMRGIPVSIHIQFLKKARGRLIATCHTQIPAFAEECEHTVTAHIQDAQGDEVASVDVVWKLGRITNE